MKKIILLLVLIALIFPASAATQLTSYATTSVYGYAMRGIAFDENYVYYSGETDQTIHKVYKNNMTQLTPSASMGSIVYDLEVEDDYIYVATNNYVKRYYTSNFTLDWTSSTYGGTVRAMDIQGDYVYAVGNTQTIRKINKSTGATVATSSATGEVLHTIEVDSTHAYVAGASGTLRKFDIATLTEQTNNAIGGGIIYALTEGGDYVYAGTATTCTVGKYYKSNLTNVDTSESFGGLIYAMDINNDNTQIAVGGETISYIKVFNTADMELSHSGTSSKLTYSLKYDDQLLFGGHGSSTGYCRGYTTYAFDTNTYTNILTTTAQISTQAENENYGYNNNLYQTALFAEYVSPEFTAPSGSTFDITTTIPVYSGAQLNGSLNFGIIDTATNKWITASDTRTFNTNIYNGRRYSFDEHAGASTVYNLWRHDTGTNGDMTLTGSKNLRDEYVNGYSNGHLTFDGTDDYGIASITTTDWEATDSTVSCMVYLPYTTTQTIMSLHSTTSSSVMEVQYVDSKFKIFGRNNDGTETISVASSSTHTGGWYHLVLTNNNGVTTLYVNKGQEAQGTVSTGTTTFDRIMVGGVWWSGACVSDSNAIVDEFHYYDVCLSTSQIATEYTFSFNEVANSNNVLAASYTTYPTAEKIRVQFSSYRYSGTLYIDDFGITSYSNNDPLYNYISPSTISKSCTPTMSMNIYNTGVRELTNVTLYVDSTPVRSYYINDGIIDFSEVSKYLTEGSHTWYAKLTDSFGGTIDTPTQTINVYNGGLRLTNTNTDTASFNAGNTVGFTTTGDKLALASNVGYGYYLTQPSSNVLSSRINTTNSVYNAAMDMGILRYIDGSYQWVASTDYREYGGLIRYSLDEYTLTMNDHWGKDSSQLTNGENHGTTFSTSGKYAGCIYFDGETDYVLTSVSVLEDNTVSFGGWVKLDSTVSDGDSYFLFGEWNEYYFEYYQNTDALVIWTKDSTGAMGDIGYGIDLDDGAWHHIFTTNNNGTLKLYVDGVLIGVKSINNGIYDNAGTYFQLGSGLDTGVVSSPKGYMDDIRVYEETLTDIQVKKIYEATAFTITEPSFYSVDSEEHLDMYDDRFTTLKMCIGVSRTGSSLVVEIPQDTVYVYDDYPFFTAISPNNTSLSSQDVTLSITVEDNNIDEEDFLRGYFMMDGTYLGIGTDRTTNGSFTKVPTVTGGIYSWIAATTDLWLGGSGWTNNMYFDTPLTITNTSSQGYVLFEWNEPTPSTDYFDVYINGTLRYSGLNNYYNNTQYFGANNDCEITVIPVNSSYTGQENTQTASLIDVAPVLTPISDDYYVYVGNYLTISPSASDANNDTITFSDDCALFNVNSTTGYINYQTVDVGTTTFNITVTDDTSLTDYETINLHVANPIEITNLNSYEVETGTLISIDVNEQYGFESSPTFACNRTDLFTDFSTSTGAGTWTTTETTVDVLFTVTDGTYGSSDSQVITIKSYSVGTPTDLQQTHDNFYVDWSWTAGANTDTFNVSLNGAWTNGTTNSISDNPMNPHETSSISVYGYNSTINALSAVSSDSYQLPNNPITISGLSNQTVEELDLVSVDAGFSDLDSDTPTFGCNRTDLFTDFSTSTGAGTWQTDDQDEGTYYVKFNVTDGYGSTDEEIITITVSNYVYIAEEPIMDASSQGNFYVIHNWHAGTGNTTDYYKVNGNNIGLTTSYNDTPLEPHAWSNITVQAGNNSGSLSALVYDNVQLENNPITITDLSNITMNEGEVRTIDAGYIDEDDDSPFFTCNRTDLVTSWRTDRGAGYFNADYTEAGVYDILISVTDNYGSTDSQVITVTVNNIEYIPEQPTFNSASKGNFYVYHSWFNNDPDHDNYRIYVNNGWINGTTNTYYNNTLSAHGTSEITVYSYNSTTNSLSTGSFQSVTLDNNPVTISGVSNQEIAELDTLNVDIGSSDLDSDTITYGCNRTDLFDDFNTATGTGSWTPSLSESGIYYVDFNVSDGYGSTDNEVMMITVNNVITEYIPPTPTNLQQTHDNFYVTWTWEAGVGNVTNSYNINLNGVWTNGTTDTSITDLDMEPHSTSNIAVYAYNSTGMGSLSSAISDSYQLPNNEPVIESATDSQSNYRVYINVTASDLDSDIITHATNRSDIFNIDDSTNDIGYWYSDANLTVGTYNVLFTTSDGYSGSDSIVKTFTISENIIPEITMWGNNVTNDQQLDFSITTGDHVAFTVDAINYINYTWKVESEIMPESDDSFVFDSLGYSGYTDITVIATNPNGTDSTTWTVNVLNPVEDIYPEIVSFTNDYTNNESTSFEVINNTTINFSFVAENATSYNWLLNNESQSHNYTNFTLNTTGLTGTQEVEAIAINTNGTDSTTWLVVINDGTNNAPYFRELQDSYSVNEGSSISIILLASDEDDDPLTFSVGELPEDAEFDSPIFSWEPDYTQSGEYEVTFYVTDGIANVSKTVEINVRNTNTGSSGGSSGSASVTTKYLGDEEPDSNVIFRERFTKKNVVEEELTSMKFKYPDQHQIESIEYTPLKSNSYIGVTIEKLKSASKYTSGTPNVDYIYSYVNILVYDDNYAKYTNEPTVTFKVPVEWMTENSITDVTLYVYVDGKWVSCETKHVSTSSEYKTYTAEVPDYGYFCITGGKKMLVINTENLPNDFEEYSGRLDSLVEDLSVVKQNIINSYNNANNKLKDVNKFLSIPLMIIIIIILFIMIKPPKKFNPEEMFKWGNKPKKIEYDEF